MDKRRKQETQVTSKNNKRINNIEGKPTNLPTSPKQLPLDVGIRVEKSIDGIEMGVLQNGLPYLTQTGLAQMVGVSRTNISDLTKEWEERFSDDVIDPRSRNGFLKDYLFERGYDESALYITVKPENGQEHYAYPEIVCMAILEYYVFEAQNVNDVARRNYRNLARYGLQKFIYDALQYEPIDKWLVLSRSCLNLKR